MLVKPPGSSPCSTSLLAPLLLHPAGWWFKPDFIINDLNINSAFSKPWHDEFVNLAQNRPYTLKGYAYTGARRGMCRCCLAAAAALLAAPCSPGAAPLSLPWLCWRLPAGGGRKVIRVEVSTDDGESWVQVGGRMAGL
jgi:hypothetical protein